MARINLEERLDADPRFKRLVKILGNEDQAFGMLFRFWRLAQRHWGQGKQLVPEAEFLADGLGPVIAAGLAERRPIGIYAKGSEEQFEWYLQKVRASKKGGESTRAKWNKMHTGGPIGQPTDSLAASPPSPSPSPTLNTNTLSVQEQVLVKRGTELEPKQNGEPAKKRGKRHDAETGEKMRIFLSSYASSYKKKYGANPEGIRDPAVRSKLSAWIKGISSERASEMVQVYLQIDSKWINDSQHDLWQFFRNLNRIGNALDTGAVPGSTDWARFFDEIERKEVHDVSSIKAAIRP